MAVSWELSKPWCCEYKPGYKSLIDKLIISFQIIYSIKCKIS